MNRCLLYFILCIITIDVSGFEPNSELVDNSKNVLNKLWLEFELNQSYRKNDFYIRSFNNYYISGFISRLGIRAFDFHSTGFVIEPYIKLNLVEDFCNNIWNDVDWHNNYVRGFGCRFRQSMKMIKWININLKANEFNIDLIGERLWIGYLSKNRFYVGHRPENDIKLGLQYWLDIGNISKLDNSGTYDKVLNYVWLESSGGFFYNYSNFYVRSLHNFYLLTLQNKIGFQISIFKFRLKPYFKQELCRDFGNKSWNRLEWLNYVHYGIGLRFNYVPGKSISNKCMKIIMNPFLEYLKVSYMNKVDYIPSYRPEFDFRLGIYIWISCVGQKY